jgi:hypothetical protein
VGTTGAGVGEGLGLGEGEGDGEGVPPCRHRARDELDRIGGRRDGTRDPVGAECRDLHDERLARGPVSVLLVAIVTDSTFAGAAFRDTIT